jgi:hypothetical protein
MLTGDPAGAQMLAEQLRVATHFPDCRIKRAFLTGLTLIQ